MLTSGPKTPVPAPQLAWLREQSARWRAEGLIDEGARSGILAGYEAEAPRQRGMQILVALGILICAVGLLLLIGYNWAKLPQSAKVAAILLAVGAAFGASARAYATGRPATGEWLAFAGLLIFANAIWLIAQVLHIQGHFPDAFLWSAIGALACAWLLRSGLNGTLAAAFLLAWGLAEGLMTPGNNYLFLPAWCAAVLVGRAVGARAMTGLAALAIVVWVAVLDQGRTPGPIWLAAIALAGCALHAASVWERDASPAVARAWELAGLGVLLAASIPLMVVAAQADLLRHGVRPPVSVIVVAVAVAAAALAGLARARTPADWAVGGTALAACAWAAALGAGLTSPLTGAMLFSVSTLAVCVALVRTALTTGRLDQFVFGGLFGAVFLLVRWVSLVENMLWSGALLLAAGGGLLLLARLWRARDGRAAAGGGVS